MSRVFRSRVAAFALLFVVLALLCCTARPVAALSADDVPSKPRNIVQACRGQLEETCEADDGTRLECLVDHFQEITSAVCKQWLSARSVCLEFVSRRAKEEPLCVASDYRRCLRKTPREKLPAACRSSDYYASLFIHKPRKFVEDSEDL